jgi:hypothetical protein
LLQLIKKAATAVNNTAPVLLNIEIPLRDKINGISVLTRRTENNAIRNIKKTAAISRGCSSVYANSYLLMRSHLITVQ